jgi:hypothetical protein
VDEGGFVSGEVHGGARDRDLSRLADLRASGTLSDAEFAAAKARLLGQGEPE